MNRRRQLWSGVAVALLLAGAALAVAIDAGLFTRSRGAGKVEAGAIFVLPLLPNRSR